MPAPVIRNIAEHLRVHGRMTKPLLVEGTGLSQGTVSKSLIALVESGCVARTSSICRCCGTKVYWYEFLKHPVVELRRPRAKPTPKKQQPKQPNKFKPPVHDGTVFGMMASQLGFNKQ